MTPFLLARANRSRLASNMPKLPSGRSVVVDFAPMCRLMRQAECEGDASLLLFVEDPGVFSRLILLHEAEFRPDIPNEELDLVETGRGVRHAIVHGVSGFGDTPFSASFAAELKRRVAGRLRVALA
jgi:hypothetical protein